MASLNRQAGFGIIELMVGVALGLLVVAGVSKIFVNSAVNYRVSTELQRIQEVARYSIGVLSRDLRHAGYWGGVSDFSALSGTLTQVDPNGSCAVDDNTWGRQISRPFEGLDDTNTGMACISDSDYLRGDILTLRYADPQQEIGGSLTSGRLYLRNSLLAARLFSGSDVSDATNAISDTTPQAVHRIVSHAYYIGTSSQACNTSNAIIPALFRKTLSDNGRPVSEELTAGVEQLQFQYGIDTDGDGSVNRFVDADNAAIAADWSNVLALRFWLLARSICQDGTTQDNQTYNLGSFDYAVDDRYRRQLFTETVRLRN